MGATIVGFGVIATYRATLWEEDFLFDLNRSIRLNYYKGTLFSHFDVNGLAHILSDPKEGSLAFIGTSMPTLMWANFVSDEPVEHLNAFSPKHDPSCGHHPLST